MASAAEKKRMMSVWLAILLSLNASASDRCNPIRFAGTFINASKHPSLVRAEKIIGKKNEPLVRNVLFNSPHHGETVEVFGVPKFVELYAYQPDEVFRYYTSDETLEKIVASGELKSGVLPYVIAQPGIKKEFYYDLEGAFITKPSFEPWQVGLEKNPKMSYVDFVIPKGMGVLKIEPGIFLIPGKPAYQKWVMDEFLKFKASGATEYPPMYEKAFKRIEQQLHETEAFNPIRIVEIRKNGEVLKVSETGK